jgi:anti-sigma factor RsiW
MNPCPQLETVGAYVLGALEEDECRDYGSHLTTCEECHREYGRLADLPLLLHLAAERAAIVPPTDAEERLVARLREQSGRAHRWRRTPIVATAAGVLGAAAAASAIIGFGIGDSGPARTPTIALAPASAAVSADAWATAKLHPRAAGTIVDFEAGNLPWSGTDRRYLVLISEGGKVVGVARFSVNTDGWAQVAVTTTEKVRADAQLEVRRDAPGQPVVLRSSA